MKKVIGITPGDPAGIGPEVTMAALMRTRLPRGVEVCLIGDRSVCRRFWPRTRPLPVCVQAVELGGTVHVSGQPTSSSGRDSLAYLEKAVTLIKAGTVHGLVTGPVSKEAVASFHKGFKGHTTYLAEAFGQKDVEMLFVADDMKLVLVTRHVPVKALPKMITTEKVLSVLTTTHRFLVQRFKVRKPRIAVLGLNPHAGEGGHMGDEEVRAIIPAMERARAKGMDVHGPFPSDTFFEPRNRRGYDLVAAMYHDQGLIALKTLYFNRLVNLTIGLPFIRTSPAHGTAFGIAGQGKADAGSMTAALDLAIRLTGKSP